ncbi:MAG: hypothetical protein A3E87_01595 [Gammaproteobacteria bacterium RIFCSPHIGHO2_12_FULL_35_23]|nr:MAG: hypothetical protein A3E87_01595 [Gammaproteobacteria bacterium RIFCSPHIGHO2_12_FULL_35_23]
MVDTVAISGLPAVVTAAGTDIFPVVQGGITKKETLSQAATYMGGAITTLSALTGAITKPTSLTMATGGGIRTDVNAGNTFLLQAYDVNGASYTTFGTLTANNTPTFDLSGAVTRAGGLPILSSLSEDPAPTLGADLDVNDFDFFNVASLNGSTGGCNIATSTTLASTLLLTAYNTDSATYTIFGTLTAGDPPTMNLSDSVTKAGAYIYRAGGTDIALADGGTNASLVASNGGIVYSSATALGILSGTATANQIVLSGSSTTPAWSTATYPATTTANQLLYSSATNTISGLTSGNDGTLITNGSGVPSISSTLPTAVQDNITRCGTIVSGTWDATAIAVTAGGTGAETLTNHGILLGQATSAITGVTLTNGQVLIGSTGADPVASTLTAGDNITITPGAGTIIIASTSPSSLGQYQNATNGVGSPYEISTAQNNYTFTNAGAGATTYFQLPAAAQGLEYSFIVSDAVTPREIRVLTAGAVIWNAGTSSGAYIESPNTIGLRLNMKSDGTIWACETTGVWVQG